MNGVLHHISGATLHKGRQLKRPGVLAVSMESLHFISFHCISFHCIAFHCFRFLSFRFVSFRFVSFRFVSFRLIPLHCIALRLTSHHIISSNIGHVKSHHIISLHIIYHLFPYFHRLAWLELGPKRSFQKLCELLALPEVEGDVGVLVCSRLVRALSLFESRWADYEEAYVKELIHIEAVARQPLERAVEMELALLSLERLAAEPREEPPVPPRRPSQASSQLSLPRHRRAMTSSCELRPVASELPAPRAVQSCELMDLATSATRHTTRRWPCSFEPCGSRWRLLCDLVLRVSELNACANGRGKGRSDMTVEVLETAAKIFLEARSDSPGARAHHALARSVLEGRLAVRDPKPLNGIRLRL